MTRSEFIKENPICDILEKMGYQPKGSGNSRMCLCPFHEDKGASLSIKVDEGLWFCHACSFGGSVIDFLARQCGTTVEAYLKEQDINADDYKPKQKQEAKQASPPTPPTNVKATIDKIYRYNDALGNCAFEVVRMIPKTFRQRHWDGHDWVWNMEDVTRVLYHLPEIMKAQEVIIVEGEKDAENLTAIGYCATTNVGGAGKWLDGYTESLTGKDVILCGDNDKPGQEHVEKVFESIAGKVKSTRIIKVPTGKDASDFIASHKTKEEAKAALQKLIDDSQKFTKGIRLPVYSMSEMEAKYKKHVANIEANSFDLSKWLPSLKWSIRPLVPGELVLIIGDTGVGKTALLQNISMHAAPMPTLFFELELPGEMMFERFVAWKLKVSAAEVEAEYRKGENIGEQALDHHFKNLYVCTESGLTVERIKHYSMQAELKMEVKPKLILVDYAQLLASDVKGSRYERASDTAESLKVLAKDLGAIVVIASQINRAASDAGEISLHAAKDSGSLENSSGVVLGAWREAADLMKIKVLKCTKGTSGKIIDCQFLGAQSRITELAKISASDVPETQQTEMYDN